MSFISNYIRMLRPEELDEPTPEFKYLLKQTDSYSCASYLANPRNEALRDSMFPFDSHFVKRLLHNKHIMLIGDSLTRGLYKDLLVLLESNSIISDKNLKSKSETSHCGDRQIDILPLEADRIFRQAREYHTANHLIQYIFTTRVMKDDVEKALLIAFKNKEFPEVLIMNSAIWDLTRYNLEQINVAGLKPTDRCPTQQIVNEIAAMEEYTERISMLMRRLKVILPPSTQVIWILHPWPLPEGSGITSRVGANDKRPLHRSVYNDGNYRAAQIVRNAGYDVLDIGFYLRNHSIYTYRSPDGVHWTSIGVRFMTQLLIGHLSLNIILPKSIEEKLQNFQKQLHSHGAIFLDNMNRDEKGKVIGSYGERLQQQLRELVLKKLPEKDREAIKNDIQLMRFIDLVRRENLLEKVEANVASAIEELIKTKRIGIQDVFEIGGVQRMKISVGPKYLKNRKL